MNNPDVGWRAFLIQVRASLKVFIFVKQVVFSQATFKGPRDSGQYNSKHIPISRMSWRGM